MVEIDLIHIFPSRWGPLCHSGVSPVSHGGPRISPALAVLYSSIVEPIPLNSMGGIIRRCKRCLVIRKTARVFRSFHFRLPCTLQHAAANFRTTFTVKCPNWRPTLKLSQPKRCRRRGNYDSSAPRQGHREIGFHGFCQYLQPLVLRMGLEPAILIIGILGTRPYRTVGAKLFGSSSPVHVILHGLGRSRFVDRRLGQ